MALTGNLNNEPDILVRKIAELKNAEEIRALYEERLEAVNHLCAEVASLKAILQEQAKAKIKYNPLAPVDPESMDRKDLLIDCLLMVPGRRNPGSGITKKRSYDPFRIVSVKNPSTILHSWRADLEKRQFSWSTRRIERRKSFRLAGTPSAVRSSATELNVDPTGLLWLIGAPGAWADPTSTRR